jgi:hypothetical protein
MYPNMGSETASNIRGIAPIMPTHSTSMLAGYSQAYQPHRLIFVLMKYDLPEQWYNAQLYSFFGPSLKIKSFC